MYFGAGNTIFFENRPAATGQAKVLWVQPSTIAIAGEGETVTAQGVPWTPGSLLDIASANLSTTYTGTIAFQKLGITEMSILLNTQFEAASSEPIPIPFQTTISSDAATVTGLTEDQNVMVSVTTEGKQQFLTQIAAAGVPAAGEYEVTANTITFNASEFADGTQITGVYLSTVSTGTVIGGQTTSSSYGNIAFYGKLLNTEFTGNPSIYIPQFSIDTAFDLSLLGAAGDDVEVPITLTTPPGYNRPF
ncbi:MAG: hypothetical protein AAFU78_23195, partial [Cyanobacteria bacterium J06633_2]